MVKKWSEQSKNLQLKTAANLKSYLESSMLHTYILQQKCQIEIVSRHEWITYISIANSKLRMNICLKRERYIILSWVYKQTFVLLRCFKSRKFLITRNHLEIQLENSDQNNIIRPIPPPTIILLLNNIDPLLFYLDLPRNMKETSKLHSLKWLAMLQRRESIYII